MAYYESEQMLLYRKPGNLNDAVADFRYLKPRKVKSRKGTDSVRALKHRDHYLTAVCLNHFKPQIIEKVTNIDLLLFYILIYIYMIYLSPFCSSLSNWSRLQMTLAVGET